MKSLFIPIILLLLLVTISRQCSSVNCSSYCDCCSSPYYCDNCATHYKGDTSLVITTDPNTNVTTIITQRVCLPCSDPACSSCSLIPEVCHSCMTNYGKNLQISNKCQYCTTAVSHVCSSVNNCSASTTCANCSQFYVHSITQICMPCNGTFRNCQTCNTTDCILCKSSYYLNTSNNRQCVRCALPNCQYCSNGPICNTCILGFFLDSSKACQTCTDPCIACNKSACLACNLDGNLYLLVGGSCRSCGYLFPNCLTCMQTTTGNPTSRNCYSCKDGWYLQNGSCTACSTPCLTCSSSSTCLTCNDTAHYLNSGSCSLCSAAMNNCTKCISGTICLSCGYGYVVVLQVGNCTACDQILTNCENCTTTDCLVCKPGNNLINGSCILNTNCSSNCRSCQVGFPINCVTCIPGDYLQASSKTCLTCPSPCVTCYYNTNSSGTQCLSCPYGTYLNSGGCDTCFNGTYYLNTVHNCVNCSTFCTTCSIAECSACESSLFFISSVTGQCEDVCGDGYVITLPCDGGSGIANDGCAEDCSVEPSYTCTITSTTNPISASSASVMKSQCYFTGQPTLKIYKAAQSLFSNHLTLVFQIQPYLFGLPNGTEGQTVLRSIFELSPLDQLTDYVISVNPSQETVSFDISYSADISTTLLNFKANLANLASNPMFQSQSNQTATFPMESILASKRLGQYYQQKQYTGNKAIFVLSSILSGLSYVTLILGLFSRQLAGLEHMLLCQTIYLLFLFRQKSNFYLEGLLGFKYSISVDIFNSEVGTISNSPGYLYNINTNSFLNNFNINFLLVLIPALIAPFFMLYRIKNKHLLAKKDFGRSASELLIGQMLLYFVVFNLYGLVAYSYLYLHSTPEGQITNAITVIASTIFSLFAISNLVIRPQIVGCFRSAFSSYKMYNFNEPKESKLLKRLEQCISWRCKAEDWKEGYRKISINFYFVSLGYQIVAVILIIGQFTMILPFVQLLVLILLFVVKPYLKPIQKFRSLFTYFILLFASLTNLMPVDGPAMSAVLMVLISLHMIFVSYIVIKNSFLQFKKRCTERSQMVRQMFKEDKEVPQGHQVEEQLEVVDQLINQYHKLGISQKFQPYQMEVINQTQSAPEEVEEVKDEISDNQYLVTEERILGEENKHLRYIEGMSFLHKYGYKVNQNIIKDHYKGI